MMRRRWLGSEAKSHPYDPPYDMQCPDHHIERVRWLVHHRWWRLLPYGLYALPDGGLVVFDREYCPIAAINTNTQPTPLDPEHWVEEKGQVHFYDDGNPPYQDPSVFPQILYLTRYWRLSDEVRLRWHLSSLGQLDYTEWAVEWRQLQLKPAQ